MKEWTLKERYTKINDPNELKVLNEQVKNSKYNQNFHISPLSGLLNDPNGFTYFNGLWHLFYQWFPLGPVHGIKYWYHVTSKDLIHWENQGIALSPDTLYDDFGVHSGSSIIDQDKFYLCYTTNHRDSDWNRKASIMLAKLEGDKFIKDSSPLFEYNPDYSENQRDPNIFYDQERERYYIFLGAQTNDREPKILVYSSDKLENGWKFEGELKIKGYENFGEMWECPNYKRIDGKDILIFSPQYLTLPNRANMIHHNVYLTGELDLDSLEFKPDNKERPLDYGFDFYAAQVNSSSKDDKDYLIAWSGLPNNQALTDDEVFDGSLTLPRQLSFRNNKLYQIPVEGMENIRIKKLENNNILTIPSEILIKKITGSFILKLFTSKNLTGGLILEYNSQTKKLKLNRSGLINQYNPENGDEVIAKNVETVNNLRIFIDSNTVEIFVNDGEYSLTCRIFPDNKEKYYSFEGKGDIEIYLLDKTVDQSFKL